MADEAVIIGGEKTILLKKAIAKILYSKGIDQIKISEILNLSQPMVSNYCGSKDKIPDNIIQVSNKISNRIIDGDKAQFHTCVTYSDKTVEGNFFLAKENELMYDENIKVVNNLTEAFLKLKGKDIKKLLPEVKLNLAMAKKNAKSSDDIASFLNGLIIIDDKVTNINGIRFGKSKHLSSLLLYLKNHIEINAIMNIAFIEGIEKNHFTHMYLSKDFKLKEEASNVDILIHKGDFGIEPCAYILGKNAVDVVNKVIKIKENLK